MKKLLVTFLSLIGLLLSACSDEKMPVDDPVCNEPLTYLTLTQLQITGKYTTLDGVNEPVILATSFIQDPKGTVVDMSSNLKDVEDYYVILPEDMTGEIGEAVTVSGDIRLGGVMDGAAVFRLYRDGVLSDIPPCSTTGESTETNMFYASRAAISTKILRVYVHVIRNTSGVGLDRSEVSTSILTTLNNYFKGTELMFSLSGSEYLDIMTSDWESRFSFENDSPEIFSLNPHSSALDIYVINSLKIRERGLAEGIPASACLINWAYSAAEMVMTTFPHEIGHCLGLLHTHQSTNNPKVDTKYWELVDGSNATTAGDYIKDTPADPNIWDGYKYAGGDLRDANGDRYNPDPSNLMSYCLYSRNAFSPMQIQKMHDGIMSQPVLIGTRTVNIIDNRHFKSNTEYSIEMGNNMDIEWTVVRSASAGSKETFTSRGKTLALTSSKPELFEISAKVTRFDGVVQNFFAKATSNSPSPQLGTLAWSTSLNGQSGGTNANGYGAVLSVSDNTPLRLEYLDPAQVSLPGIDFMCVTAANRMLRGSTMQISKADCSQGFLKIRVMDNCGTSDDFFTIMTSVSGSYYAIDMQKDGEVIFTGKVGASSAEGMNKAPGKAPSITSLSIYDADGRTVMSETYPSISSVSVKTSGLPQGEYRAVISDGVYTQEIPFVI